VSLSAVLTEVQTRCAAMTGIKAAALGLPNSGLPADQRQYPRINITPMQMTYTRATFGAAGKVEVGYDVLITLYLGLPSMAQADAVTAVGPYLDRVRAAFASDHTLGARCYNSDIGNPSDNLSDYGDAASPLPYPVAQWRLSVQEEIAANA
jgi:hypothetical protein